MTRELVVNVGRAQAWNQANGYRPIDACLGRGDSPITVGPYKSRLPLHHHRQSRCGATQAEAQLCTKHNNMSSRALRKAQKELEEQRRLEQLAQQDEEDESEEDVAPVTRSKPSLFAMLGDTAEDEEHDDEDEEDHQSGDGVLEEPQVVAPAPKPSKKSKKKKKKGKGKAKPEAEEKTRSSKPESNMDEIDLALAALKITKSANEQGTDGAVSSISDELKHLYAVLAIDSQHLQAANEMRKLFGRAALQNIEDEQARARQRGRGQQQVIGAGGKGLASLGLRRNIFIQGKEDWPKATSGGLGMEVVEKRTDGTVEYRFVHNTTYQAVQRQFQTCVASMDPDRMVQLLQFNRKLHSFPFPHLLALTPQSVPRLYFAPGVGDPKAAAGQCSSWRFARTRFVHVWPCSSLNVFK